MTEYYILKKKIAYPMALFPIYFLSTDLGF